MKTAPFKWLVARGMVKNLKPSSTNYKPKETKRKQKGPCMMAKAFVRQSPTLLHNQNRDLTAQEDVVADAAQEDFL